MKRQIIQQQEQDGQQIYVVVEDRWEDGDIKEVFQSPTEEEAIDYIKSQESMSDYAAFCSENDW